MNKLIPLAALLALGSVQPALGGTKPWEQTSEQRQAVMQERREAAERKEREENEELARKNYYCEMQGKTYYEQRHHISWYGIKMGKGKVVWSGCLTDFEAAQMGVQLHRVNAETQQRTLDRLQKNIQNNKPVNCYGTANTYSYGSSATTNMQASCY